MPDKLLISHNSTEPAPQTLHLPDGGLVLCESLNEQLTLSYLHSGESITLSGVFAERLQTHLDAPEDTPFPALGPLTRQHAWLEQLQPDAPAASNLLLGNGLGMLFIELTDRCNERCLHCYAESAPERTAHLNRDEIKRVLEEALTLGSPAVQFTGGDPLIHPDLVFAVQTARELDYQMLEIYTNGLALGEALLGELVQYSPSFAFSIYSHEAAVHDVITQTPGSLMRTLKAMHRVQAANLPLRVGMVIMDANRGMEADTFAFLQAELGLDTDQFGIDVVRSTGRGEFMPENQPENPQLQRFRHRADSAEKGTPSQPSPKETKKARRGKLCVSASGDVFPCIFSRRTKLGNIRDQSLNDIITSLNQRNLSEPSTERWQQCRQSLSCSDCQAIAYLLQDAGQVIPIIEGEAHVAT